MAEKICIHCGLATSLLKAKFLNEGPVHFDCLDAYGRIKEQEPEGILEKLIALRSDFIITTTDQIDGYRVSKSFGLVHGSTVRARHIGSDLGAGLKSIVGGELKGVTKLMEDARDEALLRMLEQAASLGANAVAGLKFSTAQVWEGAAEVLAYGTAELLEPLDD